MIAVCIGHSRKIGGRFDGGAYSPSLGRNERAFNTEVSAILADLLNVRSIPFRIFSEYDGHGYGTAMRNLAAEIKRYGATFAVELHFNAASPQAKGHEWLYWSTSKGGKSAAQTFHDVFEEFYPHHTSRGIKPKTSGDRGSEFLKLTHCPAIITEPFFGSNPEDCAAFAGPGGAGRLAEVYAVAITKIHRE